MIGFKHSGSFKHTESFLSRIKTRKIYNDLEHFGRLGVEALSVATPTDTGETSESWRYKVIKARGGIFGVAWYNDHEVEGNNIAVLIQYGHGTRNGGYVQGRDYINPAMQPLFDKMSEDIWKKVKS